MKKLLIATVLVSISGAVFAQGVVRLGTEGNYPPLNFVDDAGEIAGLERELGDELCKRAELTCEWVVTDWATMVPDLQAGKFDVIISGMSITPERDAMINFTQNYYPPGASLYLALTPDIDLRGKIATQASTIQASHIDASGATLLEFAAVDEAVAAVRKGDAVALLADSATAISIFEASGGELLLVGDPVFLGEGVGLGLREGDTQLKAKLDAAIQSMKDDGSLNALLEIHIGPDFPRF